MGSFIGDGSDRERQLQRLKLFLQFAVVAYVVFYAMMYKNTHLRSEQITGNVYVDAWPDEVSKQIAGFANLDYCALPFQGAQRRCNFVNEVDVLSFKPGNFIPTHIQVVQQKASCLDPTRTDLDKCQLDYKTSAEYQTEIDEYFVGAVETYKVQFTHAYQADSIGPRTMAQAEHFGLPDCTNFLQAAKAPMCFNADGGGHDITTVAGLLAMANLTLNSNNDESNHPGHIESFRTSGMKLHVRVHYTNILPWWSWAGLGNIGYRYDVEVVPAQSVWRSITVRRLEEMRTWVDGDRLAYLGPYDRLLIWADGIDVVAHVSGSLGHLDLFATMVLLASAVPLVYVVRGLVNCLAKPQRVARYDEVDEDEELARRRAAGEPFTLSRSEVAPAREHMRDPI